MNPKFKPGTEAETKGGARVIIDDVETTAYGHELQSPIYAARWWDASRADWSTQSTLIFEYMLRPAEKWVKLFNAGKDDVRWICWHAKRSRPGDTHCSRCEDPEGHWEVRVKE